MINNRLQIIELAKKDCQRFTKNCLDKVQAIAECRADTIANNLEDYSFIYFTYMYEFLLNTSSLKDILTAADDASELLRQHIESIAVKPTPADNNQSDDKNTDNKPDSTQEIDI